MRERMLRFLSASERVWWVTGALSPPFIITLVIEGCELEPEALQEAVARAAAANPGAQAMLRSGLRRQRWVHGDRPPIVRRLSAPSQPGMLEGPAGLDGAPCIEVAVAPRSAVVFRVHHALMDGRGLYHFAEEVFRSLRGEPLLGGADHLTESQLELAPSISPRGVDLRRFVAATGLHQGAIQPVWGRRRVEGVWHDLLPRVANGVLRFARESACDAPVRFHIPVDLRRYAGQKSTSNLTGVISIDPKPGAGVAEIAAELTEKLATDEALRWVARVKMVEKLPLWLLRLGGKKKVKAAVSTSRFNATAILSNLGRVERGSFCAPGFEPQRIYWLPPCGPATAAAFGIIGDALGVELTVVLPVGLASEGRLDRLLDAVVDELNAHRQSTAASPGAATVPAVSR